jgi:hypothetical protein
MEDPRGADDLSAAYGGLDCCKRNRKSLLCSSVRMGFLRQVRVQSSLLLYFIYPDLSLKWDMQATTNRIYPSIYRLEIENHYMHEIFASLRPMVLPLPSVPCSVAVLVLLR